MEVLHSFLHSLNPNELKVLRTSLTCYAIRIKPKKMLKLLDFLLKNKFQIPSYSACSMEVYNYPNDKNLKELKSRLKSKILDTLTFDINIEREVNFNERDLTSIKVKKKVMQFHLLYRTRGNHPFALQLLDEIITLSKKFELFESVVEGLKFKKYYKGFSNGLIDFKRINKEIAFYEYCEQARQKANDYYYCLILRTDFYGKTNNAKLQEQLKDCIMELNKDYKYTCSANVGYYLKLLELAYFMSNDNYATARETSQELLTVLINKSVFRKQRMGIAYAYLGECDIYLKNYDKAVLNFCTAQQYFPVESLNYPISKQQEFYAFFYDNKMKEAEKIANKLLRISSTKQGDFRLAKYHFLKANVLFRKEDFKGALKILYLSQEISKDKEGWDIAVRILSIMTLIELDRKGEAEQHLERLRKHMDKYVRKTKNKDEKERDSLVLKMLQQLERQSFVFDKLNSKVINGLTLLSGNTKKYRWECLSPELIPFHEWYAQKAGYALPEPIATHDSPKRKREKLLALK